MKVSVVVSVLKEEGSIETVRVIQQVVAVLPGITRRSVQVNIAVHNSREVVS